MSQRSPQLPAVTSVHVGVAKHASTPSPSATSLVVSLSNPVTWLALSWVSAHFVSAGRAAPRSPIDAAILGALLACCVHNFVDFNWQIPANAATFAALAGLATRRAAAAAERATLTARDPLPRIDPLTP